MKFWIWIVIIFIILGAGVWWFGLFDKINSFSFNNLNTLEKIDIDKVTEKINEPNVVKNDIESIIDKVSEFPKKIAANTIEQFKSSLASSVKTEVGQAIDSLQKNLGLRISGTVNEKPFTISLSGGVGKPIYFLINGSSGGGGAYVIDWGDGEQSTGKVENNEKKIIDHVWRITNIYLVNALISNNNNEAQRFSFPIDIR